MANEGNLKSFTSAQNREEAAKNGKKGGVASGKARRAKKSFREAAKWLLSMETTEQLDGEEITVSNYEALVIDLYRQATDPENKQRFQALQMLVSMAGDETVTAKIKAETAAIKARTKKIQEDTW